MSKGKVLSIGSLVSTPFLVMGGVFCLFYAFHAPWIFEKYFGGHYNPRHISSIIFLDLYTLVCFFFVPMLLCVGVFRDKLSDLGVKWPPKTVSTLVWVVLTLLILLPLMYVASQQPQFKLYYSYGKISVIQFAILQMLALPVYYFAEEFFFRGFLFLGLWKRIGWYAYWVSDFLFFIAHFFKPMLEIGLSIPVGIILCWLTLRTRSIFPAMLVHMAMGLLVNVSVNF